MGNFKPISGDRMIRILCKEFGFEVKGQSGSHVRLSKMTAAGKVGTVIPLHRELKIGTQKGILKLAMVRSDDFALFIWHSLVSMKYKTKRKKNGPPEDGPIFFTSMLNTLTTSRRSH